ncbi:DNA-directed DNA polymerase [Kribbella flavida DSM 17836]|uniref:DNA-directed DNA polymerase n=1 Tax=Kribbella flavida (strain DSM 17836 / JCM 10339 / NBRC 14399) TaxID=479435 RepID=D2Q2J2_KRIFD|nr:DNA polymerase IV [Kribbella flavida]ADB35888.1 DNA-directed DNA polymerase [Kribbella flavida DSM 17836]
MSWWLLHVDMDQFIAAVEIRRRPELRGVPVVVGGSGDPQQARQVVATASYEARAFGVHSGMPLRAAYRKCPEAVFLPSDPAAYEAASAEVMDALRSFPVVVEVWGWDECFVGASTDDPEQLAAELRAAVLDRTGLTCSIGIGDNKVRAKLATGFAKPGPDQRAGDGGTFRLTQANWAEVMHHRPVRDLWGIGARMSQNLNELGLHTVADLAAADLETLRQRFGPKMGTWYLALGRGLGDTDVTDVPREPVSRSHEVTYPEDLTDPAEIQDKVRQLAEELTREVVAEGRWIQRVHVKVRFITFFTPIKSRKLPAPTQDPSVVADAALTVLAKFELRRPVRLLGVRAEFAPPPD